MNIIKPSLTTNTQVLHYTIGEDVLVYSSELSDVEKKIKASVELVYPSVTLVIDDSTFFKFHIESRELTSLARRHVMEAFTWLQIYIENNHPELTLRGDDENE